MKCACKFESCYAGGHSPNQTCRNDAEKESMCLTCHFINRSKRFEQLRKKRDLQGMKNLLTEHS